MYQLDADNFTMIFSHKWPLKIIVKLFASSWYIFLPYIYDARSHLYQITGYVGTQWDPFGFYVISE